MILIEDLHKYYNQLNILDGISLCAKSSEITSIIGPSGSGKTTLLRCIIGIEKNFSGLVSINGENQSDFLSKNRIAFVPQHYSNFPWLTVKQNIEMGIVSDKNDIKPSNLSLEQIINNLNLSSFEDYYVNKISGGMQQRVAIGRALAQDASILAMDEPFGALDYQTRISLQNLIKKVRADYNKTILFVTHDIEEAIIISNKIVVISKSPSQKINEYQIPEHIRNSYSDDIRFNKEFLSIRKSIEQDLSYIKQ